MNYLASLHAERKQLLSAAKQNIRRAREIQKAIRLLEQLDTTDHAGTRSNRKMSAAARRKISLAQKRRWKIQKEGK
jgi:hypothetical protein